MKVREIRLRKFKRFTDATITDLPPTARLIVLVGPNGSGKSSVIDAVHVWHRQTWSGLGGWDDAYHRKQLTGEAGTGWDNRVAVTFHDPQPVDEVARKKAVYARSAYRNEPDFVSTKLSTVSPAVQESRIQRLIDNDQAVGLNYRRLVSKGFEEVFESAQPQMTLLEFREHMISDIREPMKRLFPGLVLNSLGNPLTAGTFKFDKGDSKAFLYKNLSGGEKAAFDLLLDMLVKRKEFDDTAFFIDEPEAHMAPALQSALLGELFDAVSGNSQLWLASHSIGMMRKARDLEITNPGTVVFLDFDGVNFDLPAILRPTRPDRPFWKRAMQIALDDLAGYVAPEQVVLCEGGPIGEGMNFDADCYNEIFSAEFPNSVFLGVGNVDEVQNDPRGLRNFLPALAPGVQVRRVIDRDDRAQAEITALRAQQVRVLRRRTIESYLLDDEVLTRMCTALGAPQIAPDLLAAKANALANSVANGGPVDDFKRTAGDIYTRAKQLIPQHKLGGDKRAFMKGFCAPHVQPGTTAYNELREDIFGP